MIILILENCKNYSIIHAIFILSLFSSILRQWACDLYWEFSSLSREISVPELAHLQKNPLSPYPIFYDHD